MLSQELYYRFRICFSGAQYDGIPALVILYIILFPRESLRTVAEKLKLKLPLISYHLRGITYNNVQLSKQKKARIQFSEHLQFSEYLEAKLQVYYFNELIDLSRAKLYISPTLELQESLLTSISNQFFERFSLHFMHSDSQEVCVEHQCVKKNEIYPAQKAVVILCALIFPNNGCAKLAEILHIPLNNAKSIFDCASLYHTKYALTNRHTRNEFINNVKDKIKIYDNGTLISFEAMKSILCVQFPELLSGHARYKPYKSPSQEKPVEVHLISPPSAPQFNVFDWRENSIDQHHVDLRVEPKVPAEMESHFSNASMSLLHSDDWFAYWNSATMQVSNADYAAPSEIMPFDAVAEVPSANIEDNSVSYPVNEPVTLFNFFSSLDNPLNCFHTPSDQHMFSQAVNHEAEIMVNTYRLGT
jgi:hypothetical protein